MKNTFSIEHTDSLLVFEGSWPNMSIFLRCLNSLAQTVDFPYFLRAGLNLGSRFSRKYCQSKGRIIKNGPPGIPAAWGLSVDFLFLGDVATFKEASSKTVLTEVLRKWPLPELAPDCFRNLLGFIGSTGNGP